MNETKKTGVFWGIAAVVALIATIVAWPTAERDGEGGGSLIDTILFENFKDPLVAASMKIVTFDDAQGTLENFEVRKDKDSGQWTIPSKSGYPADAVEQMRDAANSLVGIKVLDSPTSNAEDHSGMGVVEPKLEDLDVGDDGVGQLVTFKDEAQTVLGSLIIGDEVKGQPGQRYVRIPGQDPVYAVALDPKSLTTSFQEWIEEDLLQLSSIDITDVEVKDYNASIGLQGVSLTRNYTASLSKDGSEWGLASLKEFDKTNPLAEPKDVPVKPDDKLNSQKLNDIGNALDDLKFVDVLRKPEGISADLKADKDFAANQDASQQLAKRGFIPVPLGPNREIEILSANGELTATTKDGVQYILRFGNISGISDEDDAEGDEESEDSGGVNRYLMVSTIVDEEKFPAPDLKPIPQTLEDLDALDKPPVPPGTVLPPELNRNAVEEAAEEPTEESTEEPAKQDDAEMKEESAREEASEASEEKTQEEKSTESADESASEPESEEMTEEKTEEKTEPAVEDAPEKEPSTEKPEASDEPSVDEPSVDEPTAEKPTEEPSIESGETDASGEGESTTVGEAQEEVKESEEAKDGEEESPDADKEAEEMKPEADVSEEEASEEVAETEDEKLERLAAMQEKITKENERKLDDRKEKLEAANRLSQKLNARFADWYYVIPEDTYSKLRISRDELFDTSDGPAAGGPGMPPTMPGGMPNFGGGFPGN